MTNDAQKPRNRIPDNNLSYSYRAINWAVLGMACCFAILPFVLVNFHQSLPEMMRTCAWKDIFGKPCPLCGLTTGLYALLHGNLEAALSGNILTMPAALIILMELICRPALLIIGYRRKIPGALVKLDLRIHLVLLAVFCGYYIVRCVLA